MEGGNLRQAVSEVRMILMTPLKAFTPPKTEDGEATTPTDGESSIPEADLPGQLTRVLGKGRSHYLLL